MGEIKSINYNLLIDLHKNNKRQGPGSNEKTKQALQLSGVKKSTQCLQIADIGCGTGASTLILAETLNAEITAIDFCQEFLDILMTNARKRLIHDKIRTLACSMENLPFKEKSLDVIWSEGAVYNIGFEKGIKYFKNFLKSGGILAISEITWLTKERPEEIQNYWDSEYPEISTAAKKMKVLEDTGFIVNGYFPLPQSCWTDNYYSPLEKSFNDFTLKHDLNDSQEIVKKEGMEIDLYKKYSKYYSYGFYIAQKI